MTGVPDVLGSLGGEKQRDGSWKIELDALRLHSVFGGLLSGGAVVVVGGDSASFQSPPELLACGKMWMPDVDDVDAFRNAIVEAHGQVRERVNEGVTSLRRLGFKAKLSAPEPRARGVVQIDGHNVVVALDQNGDLVVEEVAGRTVPNEQRRALIAPDEATAEEAQRRVTSLVHAFWKRHGSPQSSSSTAAGQQPSLSQEELNELQAALSDDDDPLADDSDEGSDDEHEPTQAGVPPPVRPSPSRAGGAFDDGDDDDEGTLQVSAKGVRPPVITARELDEDLGTVELRVPPNRPTGAPAPAAPKLEQKLEAKAKKPEPAKKDEGSLLDAFDDDDEAGGDDSIEAADDGDDGDAPEPTATTPRVTPPQPTSNSDSLNSEDEENDLLAALGDDDDAPPPPSDNLSLEDFPALDSRNAASAMAANPTSVNAPPNLPSMPSAAPTQALLAPMMKATQVGSINSLDDDADGFDDGEGSETARRAAAARGAKSVPSGKPLGTPPPSKALSTKTPPPQPAAKKPPVAEPPPAEPEDDFDDGKTRALSVDQALLDKLKAGDFGGAEKMLAEPKKTEPDRPRPSDPAPNRGFDAPMPPTVASSEEDPISRSGAGAPQLATRGPTIEVSEDLGADVGIGAADDDRDAEIADLERRADELTQELSAVRERIAALMAARESTATRPVRAQNPQTATRPYGGGNRDQTAPIAPLPTPATATQTPSLTPPAFSASPPKAPKPKTGQIAIADAREAALAITGELRAIGQSADDSGEGETASSSLQSNANGRRETSLPSLASIDVEEVNASGEEAGEEGVSLADLQGALKEMGVEIEGGGETQVAVIAPAGLNAGGDDDGDVFGSSGGDVPDPSQEATRIRGAPRPSSIALVVEDQKARDRLRKHLEPRFGEVIDAENARAIAGNKEIGRLDAIVFVRPSSSEPNRQGFQRLQGLPRRPRVLVISADAAFDDVPAVDLRLPLGQKASEVAKQVLEGLERLGVSAQQV